MPVLSLMPVPGEVDIVIGAELMEAGRAMQRGLVSPDRTTLIASSHRAYAVSEKIAPTATARGDDPPRFMKRRVRPSQQFLAFDMAAIAEQSEERDLGRALFGASGGLGALPVPRGRLRGRPFARRASASGEPARLRPLPYGAAVEGFRSPSPAPSGSDPSRKEFPGAEADRRCRLRAPWSSVRASCPSPVRGMVAAGLARVVDFQDVAYGREYLLIAVDAFAEFGAEDASPPPAAKQIARAMALMTT